MSGSTPSYPRRDAHFEFGGPIGACVNIVTLPFIVIALCFLCGENYCLEGFKFDTIPNMAANVPDNLFSPVAFKICIQWLLFQVLLNRILPGKVVEGVVLTDGSRLSYKMNGHAAFWVSLMVMAPSIMELVGVDSKYPSLKLSALYDMYEAIAIASATISIALSIGLFLTSHRPGAKLADSAGTVGIYAVYDFWMGRELNPRIGSLDLKFFCELRPGLIGWVILNLGMLAKQKEVLGYVSASMVMVNLFQALYVWDGLYFERSILTTMDITTEGFGFMLAFGDLCWLPIVYSLQAHYLVTNDPDLPLWAVVCISLLCLVGYVIFRGANGQKDAFRRDPNAPTVSHLKYMPTKRGTKLLTSGWWGAARKINYTGDWVMGLGWCMFTGFRSTVPYFYSVYFGILLLHRALRDDHACAIKYGEDWKTYKQKVPRMFIPGVF